MRLLGALATQARLADWTAAMFAGDAVNNTENRAALHVALRSNLAAFPPGRDVMPEVRARASACAPSPKPLNAETSGERPARPSRIS